VLVSDAFRAGGFVMYPLLVAGIMAIVVAARHAAAPGPGWERAARTARQVVAAFALAGFGIDVATTLRGAAAASPEMFTLIVGVGVGESLAPLVFGAALVGVSALFALAGDLRDAAVRRPPRALTDGARYDEELLRTLERPITVDRR
jgi:hypothetical protein